MSEILTALWPVFALLCLGYGLRRCDFPGEGFWAPAEKLIYFLLFPVMLIYKLANADVANVAISEVAMAIVLLLSAGTFLLVMIQKIYPLHNASFTSVYQGGMRFNTYVALAASAALFGDQGVAIAAVIIALMVPSLNLLCVFIFSLYTRRDAGAWNAVKAVISNPLIIACLVGISLNVSGIGLPVMLSSVAGLLSGMALPLGLLAVGAGLDLTALRRAGGVVIYSSAIKLLFFPGVMLLICYLLVADARVAEVLILFSTLPTASTAYVLARQLGGDAPLMAAIITAQTLLSMITIPLLLGFFLPFT